MEDVTSHPASTTNMRARGLALRKKRAKIAPDESREAKLVRLGQIRMTQAKGVMRRLCTLGRDYPYTEAQAARIIGELQRLVAEVEAAFAPREERSDEFHF